MLGVYSGECKMAVCGIPTELETLGGEKLFTGDIVVLLHRPDNFEEYTPLGLAVVVSDEWESVRTHKEIVHTKKDITPQFFVVGIKSESFNLNQGEWGAIRVKSFEDVVDGEHWKDYGFNYKKEQPHEPK